MQRAALRRILCSWVVLALTLPGCASRRPPAALDRESALETFDRAWSIIHESHFDPEFNGVDWLALRDELRPEAAAATTPAELRTVLREMISRLGQSHFAIIPGRAAYGDSRGGRGKKGDSPTGGDGQVGLDLRVVDDRFVVSLVQPGGSAALAGVRPGWILTAIDGRPVDDWKSEYDSVDDGHGGRLVALQAALVRLAGPPGSMVPLEFLDATDATARVELEREFPTGQRVQIGNFPAFFAELDRNKIRPDGLGIQVGVIRLNVWMPALSRPFAEAVDAFRGEDGMIIDLRGNPGGLGAMVMGIAGHFLDEPVSLGTLAMRNQELSFVANPRRVNPAGQRVEPYGGPVAILTDELTASTSELFAGGMQALGRARVFGVRSAGMALPAVTDRLPNDDVLYHAIASLTTPSGEQIEQHGVVPDVEVPLVRSDLLAGRDAALEAALGWIAQAQEPELPPAREVLDRFVEAIGGEKAVRKPKSLEMTGEFSMPANGISGELRLYTMAPDLLRVTIEIPGIGLTQEGYDGRTAWSMDPVMGPRVKDGSELAQTRFQSDFYAALHTQERYESIETVARTEFADSTCFKLRLVTRDGEEFFEYFDVDTGLLTGMERTIESPMGPVKTSQIAGDYREFAGVKMATRVVVSIGPLEQVLRIDEVKVDTLKKTAFELPAEIQALVAE